MCHGPQRIFDPHLRALHRARAAARGGDRPLWAEAEGGLADRLRPSCRTFSAALALEPGLVPALSGFAGQWTEAGFDERETLLGAGTSDLIVSRLGLHGLNDLPGALAQIRRALNPGGLFLAALFGGETLHELRAALTSGENMVAGGAGREPGAARVAPFADVRDLGNLLRRAGFVDAVADAERTVVRYRALETLVSDLRDMGESGALAASRPLTREGWAAATAAYAQKHSAEGRYLATFDIVYLTGWARDRRPLQKAAKPPA